MPAFIHEVFGESVKLAIKSKLDELRSRCDKSTQHLIDCIFNAKSTKLKLGEESFRMPDEQFMVVGVYFPGVVLEVASTQKATQLPKIADDYITSTKGNICTVLGLSIGKGKEARLHIWKPKFYTSSTNTEQKYVTSEMVVFEVNNSPFLDPLQVTYSS